MTNMEPIKVPSKHFITLMQRRYKLSGSTITRYLKGTTPVRSDLVTVATEIRAEARKYVEVPDHVGRTEKKQKRESDVPLISKYSIEQMLEFKRLWDQGAKQIDIARNMDIRLNQIQGLKSACRVHGLEIKVRK